MQLNTKFIVLFTEIDRERGTFSMNFSAIQFDYRHPTKFIFVYQK